MHEWKVQAEAFALKEIESSSGPSIPTAVRQSVAKQLYTAFDLLAGAEGARRITGLQPSSSDLEKVRRIIEECESEAPRIEKVKWLKACYLLATGEVAQAHELSLSHQDPDDPERLLIQAQCLHKLGRAEEAIPLLVQVAAIEDLAATAFYNLGLAQDDCGQHFQAKESYQQALIKDPTYAYPHSRLAKHAYESGDPETAALHSRAACQLEPNDEVLWFRFALVLLDLQRVGEAVDVLDSALARFPASSELHGMRGRALGQVGMMTESEEAIRYSITLDAKNETSWYNLAFCLMLQGRFDESRAALQKAVDSGYPDASAVERFVEMLDQCFDACNKEEEEAGGEAQDGQGGD
ncbi:tetratricopeptide repeat protein [Phragmitibacter flavus]|uniref:tetratricopeptide repeat protein n=1 Tax=Phragmitibacter flavus TaxID=2576071 RepID=UPI00140B574D|nr:tetratricopeptide repeat protein [Phragmitibacter flavus]